MEIRRYPNQTVPYTPIKLIMGDLYETEEKLKQKGRYTIGDFL
ncbi:hypothetical protein B4077_1602 [Bacillus cereus]|uniref:Uncharacterized protein n=1 Tax=Bacillus cereus TaxID=1396 RepID=A0A0G8F0D2_BACCE|nr:hypothetical protein B4077_1602 [Bacillus cereus]